LREQHAAHPYNGYSHISFHYLSCGCPNCTLTGTKSEPAPANCQLIHGEKSMNSLENEEWMKQKMSPECAITKISLLIIGELSAVFNSYR